MLHLLAKIAVAASPLAPPLPQVPIDVLRARAPEGTAAWFETSALEPILKQGFAHPLLAQILGEPLIAADLEAKGQDPVAGARALEALLGRSPFDLAHALASGGVALGFLDLRPGQETPFLMLRGANTDATEEAVDELAGSLENLGLLVALPAARRKLLGPSVQRAWSSPKVELIAAWTREGTLILTKDFDDARTCCATGQRSSAIAGARRAMGANRDRKAETFAWFDLDALEEQVGLEELRGMAADPGVHFVLGPAIAYLGRAQALAMDLDTSGTALQLRLRGTGIEPAAGDGSFPAVSADIGPHRVDPKIVAAGHLHRDLGFLLKSRVDLFPPRAQPDLAEGLSNLALLVGGPDALEDLLDSVHPTLILEASEVSFTGSARPDVPLPGLSVFVELDEPEVNGSRLTSAFQSAVTLTNVERAMKGEEGLRLGLESVNGITVTRARLLPPPTGASVDLRYNLEPACALVGDRFLLGTNGEPIMDALRRAPASRERPRSRESASRDWISIDRLFISGAPVHQLLAGQRDLLVMKAVLEEGKSETRAEAEADILLRLASQVRQLEYRSDWRPESSSARTIQAEWTVHLQP